jgi:hypothetical protein
MAGAGVAGGAGWAAGAAGASGGAGSTAVWAWLASGAIKVRVVARAAQVWRFKVFSSKDERRQQATHEDAAQGDPKAQPLREFTLWGRAETAAPWRENGA